MGQKEVPKLHRRNCGDTDVINKTDFEERLDFVKMFMCLSKIEYGHGLLQSMKVLKYWHGQRTARFLSCLFLVRTAFAVELPKLSEVRMLAGLMTLTVLADF